MAIRRDTTSIRFAYPDAPVEEPPFQAGGPGDPRREMYDPGAMSYGKRDALTRKLMSFGPEGPPPGFDPSAFSTAEPAMTGMSMTPKTFTPEPEEKHPYLPGEDYWAFTKRMDKVFKRGAMDVPERGDPDFMPTMIDMYAKLPGSSKYSTFGGTTTKRKIY